MATRKTSSPKKTTRQRNTAAVDQQLARYRSMRDFNLTAEPSGSSTKARPELPHTHLPFVIQKHAASHLHYDFRLAWDGALKSWAVAKGPSFNPKDRRLAVQVEDHPLDYGGFEGIIPQGQYGGGTVMVWDQGTWSPQPGSEDVDAALRDGHLKFELNGTKLKGKWVLIRMGGHAANESKPNWLLIKEHDPYEHGPDDPPITDEAPNSAITGRSIDQIAAAADHVWPSNSIAYLRAPTLKVPPATQLATLPKESQPLFIPPQLALETTTPPSTSDWLHELKLDGYRIQARKSSTNSGSKSKVQLLTRKGLDWTDRMPTLAAAVAKLPAHACTLDGEVVVLGPDGNSNFADLQASFQNAEAHPLTYFVFDLLHLNGRNTRNLPLRDRKHLLAQILPAPAAKQDPDQPLRLSGDIPGEADTIFRHACKLHAEGIISKRADAPYRSLRTSDWLKSKCLREQEFVLGGYTLSSEGPDRIGSLLLGYYADTKTPGAPRLDSETWDRKILRSTPRPLIYAGRTGTGFTQKLKRDLLTQLSKLKTSKPAFNKISTAARRDALWIKPTLVAEVRFATWTADNLVRQAAFLGLREDKLPTEVIREKPTIAPTPKLGASSKLQHGRSKGLQAPEIPPAKTAASAPGPSSGIRKNSPTRHASLHPQTSFSHAIRNTKPTPVHAIIPLSHPEKVLDPESGLTKQQLADYYAAVADPMLPHIADRPISLVRCPDGTDKPCFFQRHITSKLPPGIHSINITDKTTGKSEPYITLNTPEALISLAQLGVLEIHPWGSRNNDLEHPDRLIFDLDPDPSLPWSTLTVAAAEVRKRLKQAGLESFLKLTGGKGLHIVAPIQPTLNWHQLNDLAHTFVLSMERDNPSLYLSKMTKSARTGKIYLDYLRNERGATAVAPYSPRARPGSHVSLPLPWSALKETARPVFSVHDFPSWRNLLRTDPWKALLSTTQQLLPKNFDAL